MCAAATSAQDSYKEKTVFKNNDVEIRQIDERTWHGIKTPVKGSNRGLPNMVEENGVKVNFSTPR